MKKSKSVGISLAFLIALMSLVYGTVQVKNGNAFSADIFLSFGIFVVLLLFFDTLILLFKKKS